MARRVIKDAFDAATGICQICIGLSVLYVGTILAARDKELIVPVSYAIYPTGVASLIAGINTVQKSFREKEPLPDVSEFNNLSNYNPFADIAYIGSRNPYRLVG